MRRSSSATGTARCPAAPPEKRGTFERADGGTLFLDEVGDMSLKTQAKVLRALDEQRFVPVGAPHPVAVDVRVIAATNKDLEEEIAKGNFREDLFYRLNVIPFFVPPLRERKEDIPLLAKEFLQEFGRQYGRPRWRSPRTRWPPCNDHWPGNVRELRNMIERVLILNPQVSRIERKHLPCWSPAAPAAMLRSSPRCSRPAKPTNATTSCASWKTAMATSAAPPKSSASSAATSTAK